MNMYPFNLKFRIIAVMCLNIGTSKTIDFPFVPNGKLMDLDFFIFNPVALRTAKSLGVLAVLSANRLSTFGY